MTGHLSRKKRSLGFVSSYRQSHTRVLLLQGTNAAKAHQVVMQGFDDRLAGRDLYGAGMYFTSEFAHSPGFQQKTFSAHCVWIPEWQSAARPYNCEVAPCPE